MLIISRNSVGSTHPLEERTISPIKFVNWYQIKGCPDYKFTGFVNYMNFNWKLENFQDCARVVSADVVLDLRPSDSFVMYLSTTFTVITGWLEDIEDNLGINYLGFVTFVTDQGGVDVAEDHLFAGQNLIWNGAMEFFFIKRSMCHEGSRSII